MLLVISIDQVLQDGATLKDSELFTSFISVGEGRDTPVGVDLEEPILLLFKFGQVESDNLKQWSVIY